eukprot:jgi/Undpi1/5376/HiC_scaffold_2.g00657.m1
MPGTLRSSASLALCLATTNAFVFRAPKVPLAPESAWTKKSPANTMAPPKAGSTLGLGALSQIDGVEAVGAGKRLPRVPLAEGYTTSCRRGTFPLHASRGLQPDIPGDGNTTISIVGEMGDEDSDLTSGPEGEEVEMASAARQEDDDGTHDDADIATDINLEHLDQQEMSQEDYSDDDDSDESLEEMTDAIDFDEDWLLDVAAASVFDEMGLEPFDRTMLDDFLNEIDSDVGRPADVIEAIHHEVTSMLNSNDGKVFGGEQPLDLAGADGVVDSIRLGPFGPVIPRSAVDDEMASELAHDPVDGYMPYMLSDGEFEGVASKAMVLDDAVHDLIRFVLTDALAVGAADGRMLDDAMDNLMWFKLNSVISGNAASERADREEVLDFVLTSMLHNLFFGPVASKVVSSLTENAGVRGLVVEDYIQTVSELYDKFKEERNRTIEDTALSGDLPLELTVDGVADGVTNDFMGFTPQDSEDIRDFDGEWLFNLDDDGVVEDLRLWPFGPIDFQDRVDDGISPALRDAMSGGAASRAVKVLVWSALDDAFTEGADSDDLMIDEDTDDELWVKLHDAISVSRRAEVEPANLEAVFDDVLTSLLHYAFFGPAAFNAVESLTKTVEDRELLVYAYVRAVAELYDEFKEVGL